MMMMLLALQLSGKKGHGVVRAKRAVVLARCGLICDCRTNTMHLDVVLVDVPRAMQPIPALASSSPQRLESSVAGVPAADPLTLHCACRSPAGAGSTSRSSGPGSTAPPRSRRPAAPPQPRCSRGPQGFVGGKLRSHPCLLILRLCLHDTARLYTRIPHLVASGIAPPCSLPPRSHIRTEVTRTRIPVLAALLPQAVSWFLATDSLALRRQARAVHGGKLVTSLELPLAHTRQGHTHAAKVAGVGVAKADPSTRRAAHQMSHLSLTAIPALQQMTAHQRVEVPLDLCQLRPRAPLNPLVVHIAGRRRSRQPLQRCGSCRSATTT